VITTSCGGDSVQTLPPYEGIPLPPTNVLELKPLQRKELRKAFARPKVVSCLIPTTYGKCPVQIPCQTLFKRIIFIWHEKLFREISFSLLQKPRDDDIIHREEEKKKKKRKK